MADALTGKTAKKQLALAEEAQAAQRAALAKQQADLDAVEAGQRKMLAGGGGGLLAFINSKVKDETLRGTFGGGDAAVRA